MLFMGSIECAWRVLSLSFLDTPPRAYHMLTSPTLSRALWRLTFVTCYLLLLCLRYHHLHVLPFWENE